MKNETKLNKKVLKGEKGFFLPTMVFLAMTTPIHT
jgi:hypothetical protein